MSSGPDIRFSPRALPVMGLAASAALWLWRPCPLGIGLPWLALSLRILGALAFVGALWTMRSAAREFRRYAESSQPDTPTRTLLERGVYRWSRNPMYTAGFVGQVGLGLALDEMWIVVAALPVIVATYVVAVRPEEAYLQQELGEAYQAYRRRVRRWL